MTKYAPLGEFLRSQTRNYIPMTFPEIERILSKKLPPSSKQHRAWWSNNPSNNVMTKQWLGAGYQTESVDIAGEKLVFRRAGIGSLMPSSSASGGKPSGSGSGGESREAESRRHPLFGCLKGVLTWGDADLSEPADPDWGKIT